MGTLARVTYGDLARRPAYYLLTGGTALLILLLPSITLFGFSQEKQMVREIGIASIALWGFLVTALFSGPLVTQELEDRTAMILLAKPLSRAAYIAGKALGFIAALFMGCLFLVLIHIFTAWWFQGRPLLEDERFVLDVVVRGMGVGEYLRRHFWEAGAQVILQGGLLAFLQASLGAVLGVAFAAFFPTIVSISLLALVFVLGNLSPVLVAGVERMGHPAASALAHAAAAICPNLHLLNPTSHFSEGTALSFKYLAFSCGYATLYATAVLIGAGALFERREIG